MKIVKSNLTRIIRSQRINYYLSYLSFFYLTTSRRIVGKTLFEGTTFDEVISKNRKSDISLIDSVDLVKEITQKENAINLLK